MKNKILMLLIVIGVSCKENHQTTSQITDIKESNKTIVGTWKLVYGEIQEEDSVQIKDLSEADFIKIINEDHFAFFNQPKNDGEGFYGGGGTYKLQGSDYIEVLEYVAVDAVRGHEFPFKIEIKGDTLIQSGTEDVPEAGIKRHIVEKYIRIK
nr:hypothetical protein [uncultured Allomuricauda sp.]